MAKAKAKERKTGKARLKTKPTRKVGPIPKGYSSVTPYLIVADAARAIEFYKKAFDAKERFRMAHDGRVGHAEITIGGSMVMLADEWPSFDARGPLSVGGTPVSIHLYVKDVDAVVDRAVAAGAAIKRPVQNQFYGDRTGTLVDPFGHKWHLATHVEDVPPKELRRRADEAFKKSGGD